MILAGAPSHALTLGENLRRLAAGAPAPAPDEDGEAAEGRYRRLLALCGVRRDADVLFGELGIFGLAVLGRG